MMYPVLGIYIGNLEITRISRIQADKIAKLANNPKRANELLNKIRYYNKNIRGIPILDPYLHRMTKIGAKEYEEYEKVIPDEIIARLLVPKAHIDLPVRRGTEESSISQGAGHLFGTALPVGGKGTNSVLTAHSGLVTASLFDDLPKLKKKDMIYVQILGKKLAYRVKKITVIKPTELELFNPVPGKDILTLFTCTPYGINTHRLVITSYRAKNADVSQLDKRPWIYFEAFRWWMLMPIMLSLAGGGAVFYFGFTKDKKDDKNKDEKNE